MKSPQYISLLMLLFVACNSGNHRNEIRLQHQLDSLSNELEKVKIELLDAQNTTSAKQSEEYTNEDFNTFFSKFMSDSVFQKNRIQFPLKYVTWRTTPGGEVDLGGAIDTIQIKNSNWKYDPLYINSASERTQIYDNFELKYRPTNERLLHWYGIESGGDAKYFFQGLGGKWFLTKKEQLGD